MGHIYELRRGRIGHVYELRRGVRGGRESKAEDKIEEKRG